jgi:uncharacterized protein involved in exopolysaccharide biosynthesis
MALLAYGASMERVMDQAVARRAEREPADVAFRSPGGSPTVGDAARRNWALILLAVLVAGALGVFAGLAREPLYTSTATLSIGRLDLTVQSIPGFAVGGEVVAAGLSRSVTTNAVVDPVARRLGLSPDEIAAHVSASTVPNSPMFTITATGTSSRSAVALANAVSDSMVEYGRGGGGPAEADRLLTRYRDVTRELARERARLTRLRNALVPDRAAISRVRADIDALELRRQTSASLYRESHTQGQYGAIVERVAAARGATSDRSSKLQLFGALGVLAGLFGGLALAVLRTASQSRRHRS